MMSDFSHVTNWRQAARLAAGARRLAEAESHELLTGAPDVDLERVDALLREAHVRGIVISTDEADECAIEIIDAVVARDVAEELAGAVSA